MVLNCLTGTLLSRIRYSSTKRRKLGNGRNVIRIGRFPRKFGPWPVGFLDMLSRQLLPGPQKCCHLPHGPEATRNGRWRKQTEAGGSRKMAAPALESVDFRLKFGPWPVGFPDMLPDIIILAPRHVSIRHTDQKRPETDADGRWRNQTEADGGRK